jgi:hypothetical protein
MSQCQVKSPGQCGGSGIAADVGAMDHWAAAESAEASKYTRAARGGSRSAVHEKLARVETAGGVRERVVGNT